MKICLALLLSNLLALSASALGPDEYPDAEAAADANAAGAGELSQEYLDSLATEITGEYHNQGVVSGEQAETKEKLLEKLKVEWVSKRPLEMNPKILEAIEKVKLRHKLRREVMLAPFPEMCHNLKVSYEKLPKQCQFAGRDQVGDLIRALERFNMEQRGQVSKARYDVLTYEQHLAARGKRQLRSGEPADNAETGLVHEGR